MSIVASGVEHRVGAPDIVVAEFPPVLVTSDMVLTPEKVQRWRLEGGRVRDLRFGRERILRRHPFENGLVRSAKARKCIPGECLERGLALDDGHLFVVIPHLASQSQNGGVLADNLPAGKATRLMGRLVHTRKSCQAKDLISTLVSDVPGNHASERVADHREGPVSKTILDVVQSPLGDVVCAGDVVISIPLGPRQVDIDALPSGSINGVFQRQHDPMIYAESVEYDEREAFS